MTGVTASGFAPGPAVWKRQAKVIGGEDCIANLTPDDEALDKCKAIGAELANL